jgi:hypothetical protein
MSDAGRRAERLTEESRACVRRACMPAAREDHDQYRLVMAVRHQGLVASHA